MAVSNNDKVKVISSVTDYLSSNASATRKEIIETVVDAFGFSEKEKKNKLSNSKCNIIRSFTGSVLTDMCTNGNLKQDNGKYSLKKEKAIVVKEEQCKNAILHFLKKRPYTKKELYTALQKQFKTDTTETLEDDNAVKNLAGNLLNSLTNAQIVTLDDGKYSLVGQTKKKDYPTLPMTENTFEKLFLERLCDCGGAFFEKFVSNLLEKYFLIMGKDVLNCSIIGGADDGGIDVIIDTVDELGFVERFMLQAKCRKNIQTTEKEVREFYGALNAKGGSRGMYVTTSTFHPCAENLLKSIPNCVGIDGHKIFYLVKKTAYGVRKNKDGYLFDETVFTI